MRRRRRRCRRMSSALSGLRGFLLACGIARMKFGPSASDSSPRARTALRDLNGWSRSTASAMSAHPPTHSEAGRADIHGRPWRCAPARTWRFTACFDIWLAAKRTEGMDRSLQPQPFRVIPLRSGPTRSTRRKRGRARSDSRDQPDRLVGARKQMRSVATTTAQPVNYVCFAARVPCAAACWLAFEAAAAVVAKLPLATSMACSAALRTVSYAVSAAENADFSAAVVTSVPAGAFLTSCRRAFGCCYGAVRIAPVQPSQIRPGCPTRCHTDDGCTPVPSRRLAAWIWRGG